MTLNPHLTLVLQSTDYEMPCFKNYRTFKTTVLDWTTLTWLDKMRKQHV